MFFLWIATCLTLATHISGHHFDLNKQTRRIYNESEANTVIFIEVEGQFLSQFTKLNSDIPVGIFTKSFEGNGSEIFLSNAMLVVQVSDEDSSSFFERLELLILQLRARKFVLIFAYNIKSLNESFLFLAKNNFARIFGTAESVFYVFLPYDDNNPMQQISTKLPLPNAMNDLNGYNFRVNIHRDTPRIFPYEDKRGQQQIGGYAGGILTSFIQKHNATLTATFLDDFEYLDKPIARGELDMGLIGYSSCPQTKMSYPFKIAKWTIMVPMKGYLDPNQYFLRPFSMVSWICIGLTITYIAGMDFLKDYLTKKVTDVWQSFSRTYLTMLSMSPEHTVTYDFRFRCLVILFAFIISNIYLSYLTSFLTVFIKIKQIDTVQDLMDNNVPLMMSSYELSITNASDHFPRDFGRIVEVFDDTIIRTAQNVMNSTQFAVAHSTDGANFFLDMQTRYAKQKFHKLSQTFDEHYLTAILSSHSPFLELLNNCIMQIMDSGLVEKWNSDAVVLVTKVNDINRIYTEDGALVPLSVHHLEFAWNCLLIGLLISSAVFGFEKFYQFLYDKKLTKGVGGSQ